MRWLTPFLASFRSGRHRGGPEPERRATPQRQSRRRLRSLAIEALEDRLCLSIDLLVSSGTDSGVMRYNGTTGAFLGAFVPPGYGGLSVPIDPVIGLDSNLYVSSHQTDSVLGYHRTTGAFLGEFVFTG